MRIDAIANRLQPTRNVNDFIVEVDRRRRAGFKYEEGQGGRTLVSTAS